MKQKDEIENKLKDIRGEVVNDCIEIENLLTIKLTDYFIKKNSHQKTAFYWHILNTGKYHFGDKIKLFNDIPYFKGGGYKEVKASLGHVQHLRNQLAHWDLIVNKSKPDRIVIRNPIKVIDFVITDDVMVEFNKRYKFLVEFFLR